MREILPPLPSPPQECTEKKGKNVKKVLRSQKKIDIKTKKEKSKKNEKDEKKTRSAAVM